VTGEDKTRNDYVRGSIGVSSIVDKICERTEPARLVKKTCVKRKRDTKAVEGDTKRAGVEDAGDRVK